jgi:hypothetical protein
VGALALFGLLVGQEDAVPLGAGASSNPLLVEGDLGFEHFGPSKHGGILLLLFGLRDSEYGLEGSAQG